MTREKAKNYFYFFIILLLSCFSAVTIWNKSQDIIDNATVAIIGVNIGQGHKSIVINEPKALDVVENPIHVKGLASGKWYYEASFPIKILDTEGNILGQGPATAGSDWMTTKMVPFDATIPFVQGPVTKGFVVFSQDDPSGMGNVISVKIPVSFSSPENMSCEISGCSSQICSDSSVVSTCEYKPEYKCFSFAKCERQKTGQCGWTETREYKSCMESLKNPS